MLLSNLFETEHQTVFILDLPEPARTKALKAFEALGDGQRYGDPEKLGGASLRNKGIHCSGLYAGLTEHVGDITHRMTENFASLKGLYGNCLEKVMMGISRIVDGDMEKQVDRNYEYQIEPERDEDAKKWNRESGRFHGSLQDYRNFWRDAGRKYADAHAKLTVWNEAQWHAREAAVAIGLTKFGLALAHLKELKKHMGSPKEWMTYSGQVTVDDQGNPLPYKQTTNEDRSVHLYNKLPDSFESAEDILAQYGYKRIGAGNYARVYAKPNEKTVLKLFKDEDRGYKAFIEFCHNNRSNPNFPRLSRSCVRIGEYNAIRMERLEVWGPDFSSRRDILMLQSYFFDKLGRASLPFQCRNPFTNKEVEEKLIADAHKMMDEEPHIKRACDLLIAAFGGRYEFDIELKNIMIRQRDGEMVFVDPIWEDYV